jgi:hypothetical protein
MATSMLFGEKYLSKVGAVFDTADEAQAAAQRVGREAGIEASQIRVLEPDDPAMARKLEPEQAGIARTLVKSHITLGTAGLVAGLAIALLLIVIGVDAFAWSPWYTLLVFGFFGAIAGLLLGGLVSLRPDHDRLITWARASARDGHWLVLVHARDHEQERKAKDVLNAISDKVMGTF